MPLVYLVVALGLIQEQALGAEAGARHIARTVSTASGVDDARERADRVLQAVVDEYGMDAASVDLSLACVPQGATCPESGATLVVTLRTRAPLPLIPPVLGLDDIASIPSRPRRRRRCRDSGARREVAARATGCARGG